MTPPINLCFPEYPTLQMPHYKLKALLGVRPTVKGYLNYPDAGLGLQWIGNVHVYVLPRNSTGRKHRAIAICPYCNTHVPAGRLQQHLYGKYGSRNRNAPSKALCDKA